ncbi:ATP-binding cassette domain-containing protein [Corynebacterium pseudopelargi]|uniref:Glutathione import ATP-binding protein GsiA n=1 Tax=Corynebacterium pseudopelargi TaxID=2080757 RepID=A0A3G6ISZ7_9CORY|nr:ABC transporter ATP-binding protein [Corynebacterium pseudopelargi]AZA08772.1 Glutathione import ATP-binding protein GsiA [Corynebacterium pseudopelargi]
MKLLDVQRLSIAGIVKDISFVVKPGERVGIIGESGSGKTLTALAIMRLMDPDAGKISLDGADLTALKEPELCRVRGKDMAMVFQEPMTALDPLMQVGKQIREAAKVHQRLSRKEANARVEQALKEVELDASIAGRYPHELSGGQRQRILIAMALINNPRLLICDEPTTALDVTSQRAVVELILRLAQDRGLLFISHDLGLIANTCEKILVMRKGEIVERGTTQEILHNPQHEYTKMLISASTLQSARPARYQDTIVTVDGVNRQFGRSTVVKDVSLEVRRGQRLGIVGGSGSGKTTLLRMIGGLLEPTSGSLRVQGSTRTVFQDPMSSLDPKMTIAQILAESAPEASTAEMQEALAEVGIEPDALTKFPHQFSGGQRQRISIARALMGRPDILLADEPVSALDVSVRAKVLGLLDRLVESHNLTMVFVSHDLSVVRAVCDSVAVMHQGRLVEYGPTEEIFQSPGHAYTKQLLEAIPRLD